MNNSKQTTITYLIDHRRIARSFYSINALSFSDANKSYYQLDFIQLPTKTISSQAPNPWESILGNSRTGKSSQW